METGVSGARGSLPCGQNSMLFLCSKRLFDSPEVWEIQ